MNRNSSTSTPSSVKNADNEKNGDLKDSGVEDLAEFLGLIDDLPVEYREKFYRSLGRLVDGFERRQRILNHVQDSLTQLSFDLKYLIFDLEATRRERDDYRRRWESLIGG